MKPTIVLNMIVKNEAHIIRECLESVYTYVDYYVIADTGSTDNTKEIIKSFFDEKNIVGKIVDHKWVDFGTNRTMALKECYDAPCEYVFVMDADDTLVGELSFPTPMNEGAYLLQMGRKAITFNRYLIFKNSNIIIEPLCIL